MNKEKPVVYICSKYSGDIETNTKMARQYCRLAVDWGYVPIAPHLLFPQFLDEETERGVALSMDLQILERCDELWVCGNAFSEGMALEYMEAGKRNMKTRVITEEVLECLQSAKE